MSVLLLVGGCFHISVLGSNGETGSYRVPMMPFSPVAGPKGLLVVNFTAATIGVLHNIATIGPQKSPCPLYSHDLSWRAWATCFFLLLGCLAAKCSHAPSWASTSHLLWFPLPGKPGFWAGPAACFGAAPT